MKAAAFMMTNDAVLFGADDGFNNPADLSREGKLSVSGDYRQFISNNAIPALSFYADMTGPKFNDRQWVFEGEQDAKVDVWSGLLGFGYERADEAVGTANNGAISLIQDFQNNIHIPGQSYDFEVNGHQKQTEKLNFYLSAPCSAVGLNNFWLGAKISYIKGLSYGNAALSGSASVESDTVTQCQFDIDGDYTGAKTFGSGWSMDIGGAWDVNDRLSIEMLLQNVVGYINWQNVYNVQATANTQNVVIDPNGNIINNPTISGTESIHSVHEELAFQSLWTANYKWLDNLSLIGMIEPYNDQTADCYAGVKWAPNNILNVISGYGSRYGTVSLGVEMFKVRLVCFANELKLSEADTLGVMLSGAVGF